MKIESYRFGRIEIDGRVYSDDLIILPDRIVSNWWRKAGHVFAPGDFSVILQEADSSHSPPELLVLGLGAYSLVKVSPLLKEELKRRGIAYEAVSTEEACRIFNRESPRRKTAAALHLTC